MPYYNAGDYYGRGDYYQAGGFFSDIFGGLGKLAKKAVGFALHTGPLAPIGAALDVRAALRHHGVNLPVAAPGLPPGSAGLIASGEQAFMDGGGGPPMIAPPAGVITQSPMGTMVHPAAIAMQLYHQRRMHPNKSTYVTRGGGTSRWPQQLIVHPKGTEPVKSRRLNVANPRALRRALRRAAGFVKLARRAHVKLSAFHGRGGKKKRR